MLKNAMVAATLAVAACATGATPVLSGIVPALSFTYGAGADFTVATGTGFGDVTARLWAVDLDLLADGGSTSGCEAADFAGFAAGSIALIQRGTCTFGDKALNAQAAGAIGVLLYNEGDLGRVDAIEVSLASAVAVVPVFFTSYGVGSTLNLSSVASGATGATVRMSVAPEDLAVPEPGSLGLLGLGLAGLVASRRRKL